MYHLRKLKCMLLLMFVVVTANAQLADGKVYNFVNVGKGTSMKATSTTRIGVGTTDETDYAQLWYATSNGSGVALRNLASGFYLYSSNATSKAWTMVESVEADNARFAAVEVNGNYAIVAVNGKSGWNYAHADGSGTVVCWESSNQNTQWTLHEVSVGSEELEANWEKLASIHPDDATIARYQQALDNLFEDKACTQPSQTFAQGVEQSDDYQALPPTLQQMVSKVYANTWEESNYDAGKPVWDAQYAKKFRVQLYEPHSIAGDITEWLGINAHNNMDNPTGIFANYRDVVYVMVEGTIKEGASLYLYGLRGHGQMGSYNDGNAVQLHEGLNVVPYIGDGSALWINYVVDTYNGDGSTDAERFPHKLSEYEPLKINIAGGHINGYYNAVGDDLWGAPDNDTDWAYYKDRASLESFTLLSHRVTMQFYMYTTNGSPGLYDLLDNIEVPEKPYCFSGTMGTPATFSQQYEGMGLDASTGKINIMLEAWNRITYSEFATLGVLNEATIDKMNEKYPRWYNNWTERGKIYDYTTGYDGRSYKEYCGGVDYSEYFNHHCLAISNTTGYMSGGWKSSNYNINTAESIIGRIANEAGPVWGPAHEIGHQHQALFTLNGLTEVTNNLHSNVAVWYMGMGTSRMNGTDGSLAKVLEAFNTEGSDYYTNNIWGLTQMYYRLWLYYHLAGNNTQFYPRLMENLRREPLEKGYNVGPGGLLRFYKHCCVAAGEDLTEFFRAHGLLSEMTDRLVGDYSNSVYNQSQEQIDAAIAEVKDLGLPENIAPLFISDATPDVTYGHDGTTQRSYWDGNNTISGNNAEVGSYIDFIDSESIGTAPTLTIEGTTVTIDNLDGVGIAIFNEKGEIVGFSTKSTFELSEECAALLASGEATVKAVNADNSTVQIEVTDPTQIQYDLLGSLLEEANSMLALSDATNTKPGFYKLSALDALKDAYSVAKNVYDEREVNSYSAAYEILKLACDELGNNADAIIAIKAGYTYWLENRQTAGKYIAVNDSKALIGSSYSEDDTKQQWVFEAAGEEDIYYIKNVSTQTYLGDLANEVQISATADKEGAIGYRAISLGNGLWALQCQNTAAKALNYYTWNGNNQIIGWDYEGEKPGSHWYLTAVGLDDNVENLYALQDLMQKTETLIDEMAVVQYKGDIDLSSCNITSNATEEGHETKYLIDGDPNTYFHTVWKDSEVAEEHYIQVDLGEGVSITEFVWTYTTYTTQWGTDFPTTVEVTGSNDAQLWSDIKTLSGLPTTQNTGYTSETLGNSNDAYRYLRFTVTETTSNGSFNGYHYFGLAEFGLNRSSTLINRYAEYSSHVTSDEILTAYEELLTAQSVYDNASATADDLTTAMTDLQSQYDILLVAYNNAKNAALTAKKAELKTLIDNTTSLISSCGTVTYTPGTYSGTPKLQTGDSNADFYVWTNAQHATEGPIANLVDGNNNTYFHSDYSGNDSSDKLDHHITVNLGEGNEVSSFTFSYVTRHNAEANYPKTIEVYGSENGTDYELLTTISGLPSGNTQTYTCTDAIVGSKFYSNLRFMVTENNNNNEKGGHPIFHMAEFTLTAIGTPESYTVELGNDAGGATNALMLAAYKENASAQATHTMATTLSQVEAAIANLQADYDALKSAKETIVEETYRVQVIGGNANGGVVYGGNNYMNTASFKAPKELTVGALTAIPLDGYAEPVVTLNGTTITVTYNKTYTVQVIGGGGNGGVTYNEQNYADGATFDAQQSSFTKEDLTAIVPEGYTLKEVTVNHETGVISVSYAAIPLVDTDKYYTFECRSGVAHSTERFIRDNGTSINGRSAEGSLFQFEAADEDNGYYIKSYVSEKYLNYVSGAVVAGEERLTVWTMDEFSKTENEHVVTLTVGNNLYLNNNGDDATDSSCTNLQAKDHTNDGGSPQANNACSLWTITEGTPLDKSALLAKINEFEPVVDACVTDPLFVTEQLISEIRNIIADARAKYASKATTQSEYESALTALYDAESTLATAKANAEAEAVARAEQLVVLREWIETVNDLMARCKENSGDATQALINEVSDALQTANELADSPSSTSSELADAAADLEAKYAVLDAAQQSTAKAELRELVAQTQALIAECGTYGNGEHMVKTPVALQVDHDDEAYYLSTNAQESREGPISNLLKTEGFFHSKWSGEVGAAHYLQVDMGAGQSLQEFVFGYITRDNGDGGPHPSIIVVYGSNSPDESSFEDLETFDSGLPTTGNTSWETSVSIKAPQPYRYLRFTVTKSDGTNGKQHDNGEYYFAMSEFALSAVSYETSYYVESLTSYGNVTEEQFLNVARAYDAANDLVENSYDKVELVNAKNNLQAYYDVLMAAHNDYSYLPVTLTTDVENPVLYVMGSQRGEGKVLQYNAGDNDFTIVDATKVNEMVEANASQLFYFTKGTVKGQVYVHPFTADGQVLAASDKTNGADKVFVAKMDNEYAMQWTFEQETIGETVWYSLKGVGAPYFSHHGGGTNKMGFFGSKDEGSRFTFTEKKSHKVTIGQYLHTSLYLNYATTIPEGVKAYIAKNPSEEGTIDLVKLQGNVLPANTGVILYSETPGTYYFLYTNAEATDDVSENLLKGSASEQYVGDETGAKKYYIFGRKDENVGLYWARMDYDADGTYVGNDEGTHFKASANKVYLELDVTSGVALSGFRFRIGEDETGIKSISTDADATIYDLYGRRIVEVVTPGIYIINGEKRYINIK